MRNSLLIKLLGAFLLVVAVGSLVIAVLTSQATRSAFNLYTTRSGQAWALRLAPDLADYYARSNSWQGVEAVLQSGLGAQPGPGGMMGMGQGRGFGQEQNAAGMMGGMGQRLILADEKGVVVADTQGKLVGQALSSGELSTGVVISAGGAALGTLIVTPADTSTADSLAGEFLASVNQAIVSSAVIAGLIALLLGAALFFQIIKPLRQLKTAASAIASGDLTRRVRIQSRDELGDLGAAFNQMAESLASAETQRRHLVADVAHELRTPLTAMQGTLEGMQDGVLPLDEEQVSALYSETLLLNRLVSDLKLLSLAEAGQLKLEKQAVPPGPFLQQTVERFRPQADQKEIALAREISPDLPDLWIDPDRITQVLNNLLANALRYTPTGGTITVRADPLPGNAGILVSISDSGQGIDADDLPHVFDRFYRSDKSRARSSGGSGLGLAIVKQLVEAHGGSVRAESPVILEGGEPPHGTRMTFTLANPR